MGNGAKRDFWPEYRDKYNHRRPHSSLGDLALTGFAAVHLTAFSSAFLAHESQAVWPGPLETMADTVIAFQKKPRPPGWKAAVDRSLFQQKLRDRSP